MPNADVAWIDVLPSARRLLPEMRKLVDPAAKSAGQSGGRAFGTAFGGASASAVESANAKMSKALRATADAAGQVRIAETRLKELREGGKATATQVATAEERLAAARRKETAANADLSTSTRRVRDAQDQHTAAVGRGNSAMTEGTKRAGIMTRAFGGVRGAVASGFAAFYAARTAVNFIGGAIGASRDLNETVNKSNVIFGANAKQIDAWARGAAKSVGLSRQAALEAAAGFGNMFTQLGFSATAAANLSTKTVQMAADLGSFNNLPTADVAEMIAGAFRGEYDSLQRLIPNISAARVESQALAMTGKENAKQLTAQEKAAAVLAIVQRDGAAAMGDFARTSDSLANSQKSLSATWDNAKARLGALLVGPATGFTHWLTDAIPRVEAFGGWLGRNVGWLGPLAAGITTVVLAVKAWTVAQRLLNFVLLANPLTLVMAAVGALVAALVTAYATSETFRKIVNAVFRAVATTGLWMWNNVLKPILAALRAEWQAVSAAIQFAWQRILLPTWNAVSAVARWLWGTILRPTWSAMRGAWDGLMNGMRTVYDRVVHPMWGVIRSAVGAVRGAFDSAVNGIQTAWDRIKGIAAKPINFVVRTVLRDGLFRAWNWVLDKLGISTWHVDTKASYLQGIPGYATGGRIQGFSPSSKADNIPIMATANEFMQPVPAVQHYGVQAMEAIRQRKATILYGRDGVPGLATGGLVALGRRFQAMGARVSEHPAFGGVHPVHTPGSLHYSGNAIDVNTRPGTSAREQLELTPLAALARSLAFRTIFMVKDHFNHLHVDTSRGPSIGSLLAGVAGSLRSTGTPWYESLWHSTAGAYSWLKNSIGSVSKLATTPFTGWVKEMPGKLVGGMWDKIKGRIADLFHNFIHAGQDVKPGDTGAAKSIVRGVASLPSYGWGGQWNPIDWLVNAESRWDPRAQNPHSTASGLFQHIDSTWRAYRPIGVSAAHMKDARVSEQAQAGLNYIKSRYGSPTAAQAFWKSHHYYGDGGQVQPQVFHRGGTTRGWRGDGLALLAPDERVLSAPQDDYFRRLIDVASDASAAPPAGRTAPLIGSVIQAPGESVDAFVQRIDHKLRLARRGGVYADRVLGS